MVDPEIQVDENHLYHQGGRQYPSVTTLLKKAGLIEEQWYTPSGTSRGTAVHELTEMIDLGAIDIADIRDPEVIPYIEAYSYFLEDYRPVWDLVEGRFVNEAEGYGGTLDRLGDVTTGPHESARMLIDIKTGSHERHHGVQLEAYARGIGAQDASRGILLLKKSGKYSLLTEHRTIGKFTDPVWGWLWDGVRAIEYWNSL